MAEINRSLDPAVAPYVPFLDAVQSWGMASCPPIWWTEPERPTEEERRKVATVCVVNTGARLIGITADHVHTQLVRRLEGGTTRSCQLGAHTFDPMGRLIDRDPAPGLDLATYELTDVMLSAVGSYAHNPSSWPPPAPTVGALTLVGGYPFRLSHDELGVATDVMPAKRRTHAFATYHAPLTDAGFKSIYCRIDPDSSTVWTAERVPIGMHLDGLSGGPVLQFPEVGGLSVFSLVAIIIRGADILEARPLNTVRADGTLHRN